MLAVFHCRGDIPTFMGDYFNANVSLGSFVKRLKNKCTKNELFGRMSFSFSSPKDMTNEFFYTA